MTVRRGRPVLSSILLAALVLGGCAPFGVQAQTALAGTQSNQRPVSGRPANGEMTGALDLPERNASQSEMRSMLERYNVDRGSLTRSYPRVSSPMRAARFRQFYQEWLGSLPGLDFNAMSQAGQIDYLLFKNHLEYELRQLDIQAKQLAEIEPLVPFAKVIADLAEARRRMEPINSAEVASLIVRLNRQVEETRKGVEAGLKPADEGDKKSDAKADDKGSEPADSKPAAPIKTTKTVANRAAVAVGEMRNTLRDWFGFYNGYDPVFTWWLGEPYKQFDQSLQGYAAFLLEKVVGVKADMNENVAAAGPTGGGPASGGNQAARRTGAQVVAGSSADIVGDPIGRDALLHELEHEMIPYTPEELIALANKEMAWCEAEMLKAARELGYGDDWQKALEHVKTLYVEPGKQPELIKNLALEAIDFVEQHKLVTVPPLARESWRMEMMTPERQLVNPFFLGGEVIQVSFPTNAMSHEAKMMSMRGNNIHFARATVFHELIPGHHLQGFMTARYRPYRAPFGTPFWGEGWALYWELRLWDMQFSKTPENRIGALFWRMHRCARIIFSLSFHLGRMTPQECIDLLVKRVGHEPENAAAEVRRSFNGQYSPLYQSAYLLGGLQFYALHKELVASGKMSERAFHDAILKEYSIPVEMVRAILTNQQLSRDFKSRWKFSGQVSPGK